MAGPPNLARSRAHKRELDPNGPVLAAALVASAPLLAALPCVQRLALRQALHLDAATWEALWRAHAEDWRLRAAGGSAARLPA